MAATSLAGTEFALKLTRQCYKPGLNMCLSPYSVRMAFCMALNGAAGSTLRQMASVLGYTGPVPEINRQNNAALRQMMAGLPPEMLQIANSMWMSIHDKLNPEYVRRVREGYDADTFQQDFSQRDAVDKVNNWVNQKTKNRIKKLFERLDPSIILLLVNAVAFDGKWAKQFDPKQTQPAPWVMRNKMLYKVLFMNTTGVFACKDNLYTAVQMDYDVKGWSMLLIMPNEKVAMGQFLNELTPTKLTDIKNSLVTAKVSLFVPKFDLTSEHKLIPVMNAMGMTLPFGGQADFSAMSSTGSRGLFIYEALQKATITVDEVGTKAAAATGMWTTLSAPNELRFNRPFVYIVRNDATGELLFTGVLEKP
ncbi:MAG: serpin family protein [Armatimonadota bacterium]